MRCRSIQWISDPDVFGRRFLIIQIQNPYNSDNCAKGTSLSDGTQTIFVLCSLSCCHAACQTCKGQNPLGLIC